LQTITHLTGLAGVEPTIDGVLITATTQQHILPVTYHSPVVSDQHFALNRVATLHITTNASICAPIATNHYTLTVITVHIQVSGTQLFVRISIQIKRFVVFNESLAQMLRLSDHMLQVIDVYIRLVVLDSAIHCTPSAALVAQQRHQTVGERQAEDDGQHYPLA